MMGLSDGRKSFPIGLAVFIQYQSVTASHPASHVAVAITLNAKASSLKMYRIRAAPHNKLRSVTALRRHLAGGEGVACPLPKKTTDWALSVPQSPLAYTTFTMLRRQ